MAGRIGLKPPSVRRFCTAKAVFGAKWRGTLPAARRDVTIMQNANQTLRRPRFGPTAKRIVVAEDDPEMRRVVMDALRAAGHDVHEVADGAALLIELAQSDRYNWEAVDLVITDVRMPICSGFRAAEAMRGVRARVRFVLMSAFADGEMHRRAEALGVPLLDKPFTIARLMRCVEEATAPR